MFNAIKGNSRNANKCNNQANNKLEAPRKLNNMYRVRKTSIKIVMQHLHCNNWTGTITLQQLQSNNCTATIAPDQLLCDNCDDDDDGDDYIWEGWIWHRCPQKYYSVAVKQIIQLILASVTSRGVVNLKHWRKYQIGMREILMVENRQIQSHQSDISAQKQRQ